MLSVIANYGMDFPEKFGFCPESSFRLKLKLNFTKVLHVYFIKSVICSWCFTLVVLLLVFFALFVMRAHLGIILLSQTIFVEHFKRCTERWCLVFIQFFRHSIRMICEQHTEINLAQYLFAGE